MRDASRSWQSDHPWAVVYDKVSTDPRLGALLWRVGVGSSIEELHRRAQHELASLRSGAAVLDVPCGGGVVLRDLPPDVDLRYVAADISPAMLDRTAREAERLGLGDVVETREADVQALTDDPGTFDLVLAFTSLHCFPDPRRAVQELARVLRPGGRLVGSVFCSDAGLRFLPVHLAGRAIGVLGPGVRNDDVRHWLVEAGFDDVRLDRAGGLTYFQGTLG
jgi:SAM-dependent methyltransferase